MDVLSSILSQDSSKKNNIEKMEWFASLMKWLQRPRSVDEKNTKKESVYSVRIKYLLTMLNKNPEWKLNFVNTMSELLLKISSIKQFSSAGFSSNSFVSELNHRLQEMLMPNKAYTEDLETLVYEVFPHEDESIFVDFIDESLMQELVDLFKERSELINQLKLDILTASYVLSVQLLNGIFAIQKNLNYLQKKPQDTDEFKLEGMLSTLQIQGKIDIGAEVYELIINAERNLGVLESAMHDSGVKVELVYLFQIQKRKLTRLKILMGFLVSEVSTAATVRLFLSQLILDTHHQKSFRSFIGDNLSLLTERIVSSHSHIGEHYVAFTWDDFRKMFRSANGGGAVTALTVFIKFLLAKLGLDGLLKGLLDGINYSGSFLLIQSMGWTLATKQPSATAPFIASALTKSTTEARRSIVALIRTQFIAVMGNLSMVFPICFIASYALMYLGYPILNMEKSLDTFESSNILGPSVLFAAFTGILLFIASIIAGWIENWVLVNQLGQRIKYNAKFRSWFGADKTTSIANFIHENANPLASNISLGFILGFVPPIMKFIGLPLDVRHVTLATGGLATSLPMVLHSGVGVWEFLNSVSGIFVIGFLNITVSFTMAFLLASLSSKVKFKSFLRVLKSGVNLILSKPWLLLAPEKEKS